MTSHDGDAVPAMVHERIYSSKFVLVRKHEINKRDRQYVY